MKKLNWDSKGISIKGEYLSSLRFTDDIILFSETATQLESMVNELNTDSKENRLEIKYPKSNSYD